MLEAILLETTILELYNENQHFHPAIRGGGGMYHTLLLVGDEKRLPTALLI